MATSLASEKFPTATDRHSSSHSSRSASTVISRCDGRVDERLALRWQALSWWSDWTSSVVGTTGSRPNDSPELADDVRALDEKRGAEASWVELPDATSASARDPLGDKLASVVERLTHRISESFVNAADDIRM